MTVKIKIVAAFIMVSALMNSQAVHAKEFLNTIMHINLGVVFGFPLGDMINKETSSYYVSQPTGGTLVRPSTSDASLSIFVDISPFPPVLLGLESHAIKFGLRGGFRLNYWQQSLAVKELNIDYRGMLLQYYNWMVGPVIHYSPVLGISKKGDYTAGGGFTLYALFGTIIEGGLSAFPVYRLSGGATGPYNTKVSGYKIDAGIGGEVSVLAINVGVNVFYSYLNLTLLEATPYVGLGSVLEVHEVCIEIYMGIPIEW